MTFVQLHSKRNATMGVCVLVVVLPVISIALRFYTRIFTRAGLKADDWLILIAVVGTLLCVVLLAWGNAIASPGVIWIPEDTDASYVYTPNDMLSIQLSFLTSALYFTVTGATKLGVLFMYYRIFAVSVSFRYLIFIAGGLVVGWWAGCTVAALIKCIPPVLWSWIDTIMDPQHCYNYNTFWLASGVCEILLDVLILTLPIAAVSKLKLSPKQRLIVSGIFLLGGFIITGIIKVALGYSPGSRVPSISNSEVWAALHVGMAIVCASLPIFKPLVNRISGLRIMTKISNVLSRWCGENLRSSSDRVPLGSRPCTSNGGNPLASIGGTPMHESYFYHPHPGGNTASSITQQEPTLEICEGECERELSQQPA
ncbi:hypothetical protein F5Y13DRAFT_189735 [Hypoxylon sp. FL1857]|nr:hypothetical protein F5Y13DRAFT_189735 [Hypoxylon sp. FL1857]